MRFARAYQTACCVVMKIDSSTGVLTSLECVHILLGNPFSEFHVIATTSPKPSTTP